MNKIIFVVGPTATGKSALAIEIAKKLNGEIISCDSMQIYKNMNIGTAKVTEAETGDIRHHLIDIVEANAFFDVSSYQKMADSIINTITAKGKTPIIAGGTGLYVDSVLYPMSFAGKEKDDSLRNELKRFLEQYGKEALYDRLKNTDANAAARLHVNDTKRIIRAIEIASGKPAESKVNELIMPKYDYIMIGLNTERQSLYERINQRVDKMFSSGLENEVRALLENKLVDFDAQSMQAIGYKEFKPYFNNTLSIEEVAELIKKNSRHFAKRQLTWFKRYEKIKWFDCITEREKAVNYAVDNY